MNSTNIIDNEAFRNIDPRKLKLLIEMFNQMNNTTVEQKMQTLFTYGYKMKQMGLQFTPQETKVIMNSLKENLTPAEKTKIETMEKIMQMMK